MRKATVGAAGRGGAEKVAHQGCGKENSDESRVGETIHGLRIRRNPEESSGEASRLRPEAASVLWRMTEGSLQDAAGWREILSTAAIRDSICNRCLVRI